MFKCTNKYSKNVKLTDEIKAGNRLIYKYKGDIHDNYANYS